MASILIVEDELDLVETYTDLLSSETRSTYSASNAAAAIQAVVKYRPDIIILDLNLPGDPGFHVIKFVREFPPVRNTPILVASGRSDLLAQMDYVTSRVDAILSKPIPNDVLLSTIDQLLHQTRTHP